MIDNKENTRKSKGRMIEISAGEFNRYFTSIAAETISIFPDIDKHVTDYMKPISPEIAINFVSAFYNEIRDIVENLKNNSRRDSYKMNINLIKAVRNLIIISLTDLIN